MLVDLLLGFFGLVALASLAGSLARRGWLLELASHFRPQYTIVLSVGAVLAAALRQPLAAILLGTVAIYNGLLLAPFYRRRRASRPQKSVPEPLELVVANVRTKNRSFERAAAYFERLAPDLLALVEVDEGWLDGISRLRAVLPYSTALPDLNNYGLALFSKLPLENEGVHHFLEDGPPSLVADLRTNHGSLHIILTHPPPPLRADLAQQRDRQLRAIGSYVREQSKPVVLLGDLNITPWSPAFHELLRLGELRDGRLGHGIQASWPTLFPPFLIPIDHALVSDGWDVVRFSAGDSVGSDHLPLIVHVQPNGRLTQT